jgi:hypothetical protein
MSLLVAGILFFVLSPGVLLTIPPGSRGLFLSGQTSVLAALVHAVVFVAVAYLLTSAVEGFVSDPQCTGKRDGTKCGQGLDYCMNNRCMPRGGPEGGPGSGPGGNLCAGKPNGSPCFIPTTKGDPIPAVCSQGDCRRPPV